MSAKNGLDPQSPLPRKKKRGLIEALESITAAKRSTPRLPRKKKRGLIEAWADSFG
ncbi:MAG: hypothetical protein MI861_01880 [Pirellulales bacterium]|nr:hypothetical protein [Pirellulales bacterium]